MKNTPAEEAAALPGRLEERAPGRWELYSKSAESWERVSTPEGSRLAWRREEGWAARAWEDDGPRFAAATSPGELLAALADARRFAPETEPPPSSVCMSTAIRKSRLPISPPWRLACSKSAKAAVARFTPSSGPTKRIQPSRVTARTSSFCSRYFSSRASFANSECRKCAVSYSNFTSASGTLIWDSSNDFRAAGQCGGVPLLERHSVLNEPDHSLHDTPFPLLIQRDSFFQTHANPRVAPPWRAEFRRLQIPLLP